VRCSFWAFGQFELDSFADSFQKTPQGGARSAAELLDRLLRSVSFVAGRSAAALASVHSKSASPPRVFLFAAFPPSLPPFLPWTGALASPYGRPIAALPSCDRSPWRRAQRRRASQVLSVVRLRASSVPCVFYPRCLSSLVRARPAGLSLSLSLSLSRRSRTGPSTAWCGVRCAAHTARTEWYGPSSGPTSR